MTDERIENGEIFEFYGTQDEQAAIGQVEIVPCESVAISAKVAHETSANLATAAAVVVGSQKKKRISLTMRKDRLPKQ